MRVGVSGFYGLCREELCLRIPKIGGPFHGGRYNKKVAGLLGASPHGGPHMSLHGISIESFWQNLQITPVFLDVDFSVVGIVVFRLWLLGQGLRDAGMFFASRQIYGVRLGGPPIQ